MALTYQSIGSTGWTSINGATPAITITKPTGLAEGDLMLAVIGVADFNMGGIADNVTGWTKIGVESFNNIRTLIAYYKIADSSDVAASNFSFTVRSGNTAGANDYIIGSIIRISGDGTPSTNSSLIDFGTDTDGGTTHTFTGGVSPGVGNSILVMGVMSSGNNAGTFSTYAITTSNPTWTERQDEGLSDTADYAWGLATAPRTESTATGDFSVVDSISGHSASGVLIAIIESQDASVSPSVITVTASVQEPTVSGSANVSPSAITVTASVQEPTVSTPDPEWTTQNKSSASTWTNQNKS